MTVGVESGLDDAAGLLPSASARADLASDAMATIRDADENARSTPGRPSRGSSDHSGDPKLRAVTEMILAMPVNNRLRPGGV